MDDAHFNRREFMLASLVFSTLAIGGISGLRAGAAWAKSQVDESLAHFARLLFPHQRLADEVYAGVMGDILRSFAADPASADLLDTAQAALDAQQETSWFDLDEADQVTAICNIQGEAYFATIVGAVRSAFYNDPAVWRRIDYPGSSKEFGGYKDRGFDDIEWLPGTD